MHSYSFSSSNQRILTRGVNSSATVRQSSSTQRETYNDASYGIAYRNEYEGGFYYGDMQNADGGLPTCFEEDIECQLVSENREKLVVGVTFSLITLVLIAVILAYCCQSRRQLKDKDKRNFPDVEEKEEEMSDIERH